MRKDHDLTRKPGWIDMIFGIYCYIPLFLRPPAMDLLFQPISGSG